MATKQSSTPTGSVSPAKSPDWIAMARKAGLVLTSLPA